MEIHDRKFKIAAVKKLAKSDISAKELANQLGVNYQTLLNWNKKFQEQGLDAFPRKKKYVPRTENFFSKKDLISRGWTEGAIKKFLKRPGKTVVNPIYNCASPMKLYGIPRVQKVEQSKEFIEWMKEKESKKDQYKKMVETKTDKLLKFVQSLEIKVEIIEDKDALLDEAIEHYMSKDGDRFASKKDSKDFLDRITINFIRHMLTRYDSNLRSIKGYTGNYEAYCLLVKRIFDAISNAYPHLREECDRQADSRLGEWKDFSDEELIKEMKRITHKSDGENNM